LPEMMHTCRWQPDFQVCLVCGRLDLQKWTQELGEILLEKSLYEKYGGFSTVSKIVMTLYDKLLDDDDVGPFFDDVDMPKLIDHQTKFVSSLMGGPASFTDTHIENAHKHLVINDAHFDQLKVLVNETLGEFGVDPEDIDTVLAAFEQRRGLLIEG